MTSASPATRSSSLRTSSTLAAYVELMKPRITVLLLITCVAAMPLAAGGMPPLGLVLATAVGLALSSGGASALNHVYDRDIDAKMVRTARRPVVTGVVSPAAGTAFGVALLVLAALVLLAFTTPLAAATAISGGVLYVLLYTVWLKRRTPQNIVWGGIPGAIPPLVGHAAVTGSLALPGALPAWSLFTIVFLWTPPHFWALALLIRRDYAAAGVPMLPVTHGERRTVTEIWWYSVVLVAASLVPVALGVFGWVYAVADLLLGARLLQRAWQLRRITATTDAGTELVTPGSDGHTAARRMFLFSMAYLALLFLAAVVDGVLPRLHV